MRQLSFDFMDMYSDQLWCCDGCDMPLSDNWFYEEQKPIHLKSGEVYCIECNKVGEEQFER